MSANLLGPSSAPTVPPLLLSARDAAKCLAVSERTLWSLTARGELPVLRIGRGVRYAVADLRDFVQRTSHQNGSENAKKNAAHPAEELRGEKVNCGESYIAS